MQEHLLRSIIDLFVYNNCDYFIYLDAKQNRYTMFSGSQSGTPLPPSECLDYESELVKYARSFVVPEDQEKVIREMGLKRVIEQLEKNGLHTIYCGVEDPVRGYTRKRLEYRYYDRNKQMILLSRTDLTDVYLEQQRQQKVLQEALKTAEEANRTKSLFFSNMSHDIRTPMNAIVGFATLLEHVASNEEQVRIYTQKILNSSKLLLSLLNDVLDISQIESGKAVLNTAVIQIPQLLNELDTMIRPQTLARRQEFHIQAGDLAHRRVYGDEMRITQILMNILNNAVKYTPDGGRIDFVVRSTQQSEGYDEICFIIKDNGIGISRDFIKDIFEPFSREQNHVVDKIQGTGLGMAITKSLVELLGGQILVDSEPGKGSTFSVLLRLKAAGEPQNCEKYGRQENREPPEQKLQSRINAGNLPLQGIHILAAEDNELNAEILSELLDIAGAECEIVSNGLDVIRRFQELQPDGCDLILMDIRMPVMDGCEAARNIRNLPWEKAKTVPIIALTANAFTADVSMALEAGMDAHLTKPLDVVKLYGMIREYAGK